jgi:hypothetical protein
VNRGVREPRPHCTVQSYQPRSNSAELQLVWSQLWQHRTDDENWPNSGNKQSSTIKTWTPRYGLNFAQAKTTASAETFITSSRHTIIDTTSFRHSITREFLLNTRCDCIYNKLPIHQKFKRLNPHKTPASCTHEGYVNRTQIYMEALANSATLPHPGLKWPMEKVYRKTERRRSVVSWWPKTTKSALYSCAHNLVSMETINVALPHHSVNRRQSRTNCPIQELASLNTTSSCVRFDFLISYHPIINLLKTKRMCNVRIPCVPRSKHSPPRS